MKIWLRTTIWLYQTLFSIKSNYGLVLSSIIISVIPSSDGINLLKIIPTSTMILMIIVLHTMMNSKDSRNLNQKKRMLSAQHQLLWGKTVMKNLNFMIYRVNLCIQIHLNQTGSLSITGLTKITFGHSKKLFIIKIKLRILTLWEVLEERQP